MKRMLLAGLAWSLLTGVSVAQETVCARTDVVFCQGFEAGVPGWAGFIGSWSVVSDAVEGTRALRMTYGAAPCPGDACAGAGYGGFALPAMDEFRMRWYEKFSAGWRWSSIATKGWILSDGSGRRVLYALNDLWGSGARVSAIESPSYVEIPQNQGADYAWTGSALDTWSLIEIHVKLNAPTASDGVYELWVNGVLRTRATNLRYRSGSDGVSDFNLSGYWNCPSNDCAGTTRAAQHRLVDAVVIARGNTPIGALSGAPSPQPTPSHACDTTPPTDYTVQVGQAFRLGWCLPETDVNGQPVALTGWTVQRDGVALAVSLAAGTTVSAGGERYYETDAISEASAGVVAYRVVATNAQGNSPPSPDVTVTVVSPAGPPRRPGRGRATAGV